MTWAYVQSGSKRTIPEPKPYPRPGMTEIGNRLGAGKGYGTRDMDRIWERLRARGGD